MEGPEMYHVLAAKNVLYSTASVTGKVLLETVMFPGRVMREIPKHIYNSNLKTGLLAGSLLALAFAIAATSEEQSPLENIADSVGQVESSEQPYR